MRNPEKKQTAGTINGTPVTIADFTLAVNSIRGFGQNRDTETSASVVDLRAWEQLASARTAKANGLNSSLEEVRSEIKKTPAFQGAAGFDINIYRAILKSQLDMTPAIYEKLVAHQLSLMKNAALIQTATWISPMELEDELAGMTDLFTVQTTVISNTFADAEMDLNDKDYLKFYEGNKADFALPDQVSVKYVEIPVSNYLAHVSVSEEDMNLFYDDNIEEYQRATTNNTTETAPFEDVKDEIKKEMLMEEARNCATTSITFNVYGSIADQNEEDTIDAIEEFAKSSEIKIKTSPMFSVTDQISWVQNAEDFLSAAFELDPERADARYGIVVGDDYIYIIEQLKESAAHTPEFDLVRDQIRDQALAKARTDAFSNHTKKLHDELSEILKKGISFTDAAESKAMNVSTSITYSVSNLRNQQFKNSFSIAYGAMSVKKGSISKAVPVSATSSLLIYVQERKPGDALSAEMMRPQVRSQIARRRANDIFSEWLKWNLKQQDFKPVNPLIDENEEPSLSGSAQNENVDEDQDV